MNTSTPSRLVSGMSRATGVGPVTDDVCREYVKHMEALILSGVLNQRNVDIAAK